MFSEISRCSMAGCDGAVHARSLCHTHYMRNRRHGSPEAVNRPPDWGARDTHPMYERWKSMARASGGGAVKVWGDFWIFVADIGEQPSPEHRVYRLNPKKPWGPKNFEWRELVVGLTQEGREAKNAYMRAYNARSPHVVRRAHLKAYYGVTLEWYDQKFREQGGLCAVCRQPETMEIKKGVGPIMLAVDHHHGTKKPRGLLCHMCNRGIGMLGDDPASLRAAAAYLESHAVDLRVAAE